MVPGPSRGRGQRSYFGLYRALVTSIQDPMNRGRVQLRLPDLAADIGEDLMPWAMLCTPYADNDQGFVILPEVGSQVVVAFEAGDLNHAYVVGPSGAGSCRFHTDPSPATTSG